MLNMKRLKSKKRLKSIKCLKTKTQESEKGFAVVEAITFLMAFIVLTLYVIDLFTAIHTGIVGSIAARTYLFETLQHRSSLTWLRQGDSTGKRNDIKYSLEHERFHAILDEDETFDDTTIREPARALTQVNDDQRIEDVKNNGLDSPKNKTTSIKIKSGYGICLDYLCPEEPQ